MVLLVFLHGVGFVEKQIYQYLKANQTQHHRMPLDLKITSLFIVIGKFNDIWLSVMPIFPEPVNGNGIISVSYIAKDTCCRDVIVPRYQLALQTDCKSYSFEVPFKINSKS